MPQTTAVINPKLRPTATTAMSGVSVFLDLLSPFFSVTFEVVTGEADDVDGLTIWSNK